MSLLPPVLASALIDGSLPWDHSVSFHIDAFLREYTLHDSHWVTLHLNCGWDDTATIILRFDPVWNHAVSTPTSKTAEWPLLFLRFFCVSNVRLRGFSDIGGIQRGISSVSVERLSEEEVITTILDHYGAEVSIQHLPLLDTLVIAASGEVISLLPSYDAEGIKAP